MRSLLQALLVPSLCHCGDVYCRVVRRHLKSTGLIIIKKERVWKMLAYSHLILLARVRPMLGNRGNVCLWNRDPGNFCLWKSEQSRVLESGIPESRILVLLTNTWNPESTAWNPESKTVRNCLTWGDKGVSGILWYERLVML